MEVHFSGYLSVCRKVQRRRYDELIYKIISWVEALSDVKAVFIVGSRARADHPADMYSDLDLVVVATNLEQFLSFDILIS